MKKILLFISALMLSNFIFAQVWPTAETTGGAISITLQNIPATYAGKPIAVFVTKSGILKNIGQGTVAAGGGNTTYNGQRGAVNPVVNGDPITVVQIYDAGTNSYFELLNTGSLKVVNAFGSFFSVTFNNASAAPAPSTPLPVELTSFTGKFSNKTVTLDWATASEENHDYFTVERSTDGKTFDALDNISGAGTTVEAQKYQYTDENPENGVNYYRLRETDFDGKFTYSEVIAVKTNEVELTVNIYPNPVVSVANITLPATNGNVTIKVMDVSGRMVLSKVISNTNEQTVQLDLNELQAGMYMIMITDGEQVVSKQIQVTK